jgi:hypothetical protein
VGAKPGFGNAFYTRVCERPPRPLLFKDASRHLLDVAANLLGEEGNARMTTHFRERAFAEDEHVSVGINESELRAAVYSVSRMTISAFSLIGCSCERV